LQKDLLKSSSIATAGAGATLPSLLVAITAVKRSVTIRFKRKFGDLRSALGAGPMSLNHLALTKVATSIHIDWPFLNFVGLALLK
jgi:hypothetical protein